MPRKNVPVVSTTDLARITRPLEVTTPSTTPDSLPPSTRSSAPSSTIWRPGHASSSRRASSMPARYWSRSAWHLGPCTAGPLERFSSRNWMPASSATLPMRPSRASTSRTKWPFPMPPKLGLQLISPMVSTRCVNKTVRAPARAAAAAASHPACPPPITTTSTVSSARNVLAPAAAPESSRRNVGVLGTRPVATHERNMETARPGSSRAMPAARIARAGRSIRQVWPVTMGAAWLVPCAARGHQLRQQSCESRGKRNCSWQPPPGLCAHGHGCPSHLHTMLGPLRWPKETNGLEACAQAKGRRHCATLLSAKFGRHSLPTTAARTSNKAGPSWCACLFVCAVRVLSRRGLPRGPAGLVQPRRR